MGKLDRLEAFASMNGPQFYGLPVNSGTITLERKPYLVPESLDVGHDKLVPLAAGETLNWRFVAAGV